MIFFKDQTQHPITQIQINPDILQKGKFKQLGILWDYYWNRYFQVKFYITQTKKKKIKYTTSDEFILRVDSLENLPYLLNNLEQIKYLQWFEIQTPNLNQLGRWTVCWKGKLLEDIGGQYSNGQKLGFWKEPISNYWTLSQTYQVGEYQDGQKSGTWKYIYEDQVIGGGSYDENHLKNGRWIELSENFSNISNIIYSGEYKNDKKIDKWDISYRFSIVYPFELIGGGSYNQEGCKDGKWIDLIDNFYRQRQVIFDGEYQNCKKVGRWDTYLRIESLFSCEFKQIGGGSYNTTGVKNGKWIELSNNFYNYSQVTYEGEYQNGKKVNQWVTSYKQKEQLELFGGGYYDEGIKHGAWVELSNQFRQDSQITYKGKYHLGKKFGKWDFNINMFEQIGGGFYNEQGIKIGSWIEMSEFYSNLSQVIYKGEYYFGKKIGRWNILWKNNVNSQQFGGGLYDDNGLKKGIWIELANDFNEEKQVTYQGEYNYGQKVGRWDTYFRFFEKNDEIGCGFYNEEGIQNGMWIELDEDFKDSKQIIYKGEYKDGKKIEKWIEYKRDKWNFKEGFLITGSLNYPK